MTRHGRSHGNDLDAPHPLEKVIGAVAAESFEPDHGVREDRWAQNIRRNVDARLAALRRQLSPPRSPQRQVARVSVDLRMLDRAALLARLDILRQAPHVRFAHLELSGLTTEDLRQLIAEIETERTQETQK